MGAQGTGLLNFGAFPGKQNATLAITGQASILAGSLVEAWIYPVATTEHSSDEQMIESIQVVARDVVAGTGFTIYGFCTQPLPHSEYVVTAQNLYGNFNVAWVWN